MPAMTGDHAPEPESFVFEQLNPAGACRCYLVADPATRKAMLVDPRRDFVDLYLDALRARDLELVLTVETHTHDDHLSGSKRLKDLTGCSMAMHHVSSAPCVDRPLQEDDAIELGELSIRVWETPGHTMDAIVLLLPDRALTGDTILLGGAGRTDLGGDALAQFQSLQRFRSLPENFQIWPAHDDKGRTHATVGEQLESNPHLRITDADAFCRVMNERPAPTPVGRDAALDANTRCL